MSIFFAEMEIVNNIHELELTRLGNLTPSHIQPPSGEEGSMMYRLAFAVTLSQ